MNKMDPYLRMMVKHNASDLFFSPGTPLHMKVEGVISPVQKELLVAEVVKELANSMMNDAQRDAFNQRPEMNLGLSINELGRFRINIYRERQDVAMVIRYLSDQIPTVEELNLPIALNKLAMAPRGLVLVVGATGCGKSTTLASMIDYRNQNTTSHILTIEDPIEYIYRYKHSIVDQREIGTDTMSCADALENAMREAPDVIMIGEIRDRATMQHAIAYAETGHLCMASLHASNSNHALHRALSFFPEEMYHQLYLDLSQNLHAVVSQRLAKGVDGKRIPAVEVLLATAHIRDLILRGAIDEIREAMERGHELGMQTFDQSLFDLFKQGKINKEEALKHAESVSNLNLMIRTHKSGQARDRGHNQGDTPDQ